MQGEVAVAADFIDFNLEKQTHLKFNCEKM
jgi:hypothetical protein